MSNLSVSKEYGLTVVIHHNILFIDGVCCDNHDANITCVGVMAFEYRNTIISEPKRGKRQKIRVSQHVPNKISKEIKFTY